MSEIKNIITFTLSDKDEASRTYEQCIDFLTNVVPNRNGIVYFTGNSFNLEDHAIVLFKYKGKLVAKGIIIDVIDDKNSSGIYNGYYIVEDIEIFKSQISSIELNKYVPEIDKLTRDQYINIKYLWEINQMIKDYTSGDIIKDDYQIWSMNISKRDYKEAWDLFKNDSCISIDYFLNNNEYDYTSFSNKQELEEFLKDKVHEGSTEPELINRFVNKLQVGDMFIAHKGRSTLAGIGRIVSDYIFQDDYLKHIRKIKWIYTPDDLKLKDGAFFKPHNIVRLDEKYTKFVNEIFARIAGKDKRVRKNLLEYLFNQYYTNYHTSEKGQRHSNTYNLEKNHIQKYWNIINEKASNNEDFIDIIWENIFNRPDSVLRVGSRNLRNMNKEKYEFTDEEMDESAILFYNTVNGILNTQDIDEQKRILNEFSQNKLSKGLGIGRLTPVLFYLNDDLCPINNKSIKTFKFMSLALGSENEISGNLNEYIDNNYKYKELLKNLGNEFSSDKFNITDAKVFDEFCHWICAEDDYLWSKKTKILPFSIINDVPEIEGELIIGGDKVFESNEKRNIIYFGAPGTGKSYNLNQDKKDLLENYPDNYERVTFHPDYSYANFVGTYKPVPKGEDITYKYVPGPFMRILKKSLENPDKPYLLIIEEINRANVAAVFGDVFQLLDRNENYESEYDIDASEDMKSYLNQDKIILPKNLFIWATMNSADQGVFPMDTAFKRRWDFKYFSINHNQDLIDDTHTILNDETIYWNDLRDQINNELLSYKVNEDKLMGPFFAFNEFMGEEIPTDIFKDIFKNKIIMYLFEDAAKPRRNDLFSGVKTKNYVTYSQICEAFDSNGLEIFCDNIKNTFLDEDEE
ncbi:MAG: AAA family ATPase [Methanobrevibacter sp.]|nr:AAA family ATPase [Methanobrevibacter sp.]